MKKGLRRWWTARHVYVDWYHPIHASYHTIAIMVISTTIRTASHADHPLWIRHLIVQLSESRCHLIGNRASHYHDVGLAGGRTKDDAEAVLIVSRHGDVHHLNATTCEGKRQRPQGAIPRPADNLINTGPTVEKQRLEYNVFALCRMMICLQDMFNQVCRLRSANKSPRSRFRVGSRTGVVLSCLGYHPSRWALTRDLRSAGCKKLRGNDDGLVSCWRVI